MTTRTPGARAWALAAAAASSLAGCASSTDTTAASSPPPPSSSNSEAGSIGAGASTSTGPESPNTGPGPPQPPEYSAGGEAADDHGVDRCRTSMLRGRIGDKSTASGTMTEKIFLTNTSGQACTLYGYPGVEPAHASGALIEYETVRSDNPAQQQNASQQPQIVTLQPGDTAHAVLSYYYGWMTAQQKENCVHWDAIAVTPPDERDHLLIPDSNTACRVGPLAVGPVKP